MAFQVGNKVKFETVSGAEPVGDTQKFRLLKTPINGVIQEIRDRANEWYHVAVLGEDGKTYDCRLNSLTLVQE